MPRPAEAATLPLDAAFVVAAQLLLGAGLVCAHSAVARARRAVGARRCAVGRARAARAARSAALLAVPATAAALSLGRWLDPAAPFPPAVWIAPWSLVVGGAPATIGLWLLLDAARLECAGRVDSARRQGRRAGAWAFGGVLLLLGFVWGDLLLRPDFRHAVVRDTPGAGLWLLGGMIATGAAGLVAALAGLAGKPRPSAGLATAAYLLGLAGLLSAARLAGC